MALIIQDASGNSYALSVNSADQSLLLVPAPNVTPSAGANSITVTALAVVNAAMQEIGVLASGESASNDDQAWVLQKLQRLIDRYNARLPMVYNVNFFQFNLQANHSPHTIGPAGDFEVNQRPVDIESISLILTSTDTPVELLLNKRDQDWWAAQTIKGLTSTLPTDFYYSPDWPNGSIYFWPISTAVNAVLIQSRLVLAEITSLASAFTMPPAYWDLIVYELAMTISPSFERPVTADLRELYQKSLKAVQVNNVSSPRLASDSPSQPGTSNARPNFNFLTGLTR